jgi:hypothetical protein
MLLVKLPSPPGLPPGVLPCPSEPSPPADAKGLENVATRGIKPPGASAGAMAPPATRPAARRAETKNDAAQREERPLL